jgi:hypothetical protein
LTVMSTFSWVCEGVGQRGWVSRASAEGKRAGKRHLVLCWEQLVRLLARVRARHGRLQQKEQARHRGNEEGHDFGVAHLRARTRHADVGNRADEVEVEGRLGPPELLVRELQRAEHEREVACVGAEQVAVLVVRGEQRERLDALQGREIDAFIGGVDECVNRGEIDALTGAKIDALIEDAGETEQDKSRHAPVSQTRAQVEPRGDAGQATLSD